MCLEQIKNGEIEDVTEKCAIKQARESFLSVLRRCPHHKSDVFYPRQNPSKKEISANGGQRGIYEEWSRMEELHDTRRGEVTQTGRSVLQHTYGR